MAPEQDRLPRLVDGLDLRTLPIGPAEAFVLSRIDGSSTEAEIASAVGMALTDVQRILTALAALGAVRFEAGPAGGARVVRAARSYSGQYRLAAISVLETRATEAQHPGALLYDPRELEEDVEIDPERKKRILDLYYRLDTLNHYELLGVEPTADKRVIKAKYYEVVNVFHPDRYYGKRLGTFKAKLERVFQRLTEAHEVLTRAASRAEYDAYLNAERSTQALDRKLHDREAHARELRDVQARIQAEVGADVDLAPAGEPMVEETGVRRSWAAPSIPPSTPRPAQPSSQPGRVEIRKPDADARRRALARKLGVSHAAMSGSSSTPPASASTAARQHAMEELKRRHAARISDATSRQVADYQARAEAAISEGNLIEAVNALRIAVSLAPEHDGMRARLLELEREATRQLSNRYLEQAAYEERERRWADAARSYERALVGRPDAAIRERLACCLLNAGGDVRRALEAARAAVLASPGEARFRVTLARAYLAAKMRESALGELERAANLAPTDDSIRDLIRRVRRGET